MARARLSIGFGVSRTSPWATMSPPTAAALKEVVRPRLDDRGLALQRRLAGALSTWNRGFTADDQERRPASCVGIGDCGAAALS